MLSIFDRVLEQIDTNRIKKDNCIPFKKQLPRLSEYMPGIEKKKYYLISGASGTGKSQFVDEFFVFNPLEYVLENDTDITVKIKYYSFELDADTKMKQWLRRKLYNCFNLRVDDKVINSVKPYQVSDSIMMALKETRSFFKHLEPMLEVIDTPKTAQEIISEIHQYAKDNGTIIRNSDGSFNHYEANNKEEYVIIVVDHYSLLKVDGGSNIKAEIEKLSKGFVDIRNKYGYIPVPLQQTSAESENVEHFKLSKLEPSKNSLAESKLTYNDCDVALGIFNPYRHELSTYRKYNILELGDSFRNISIFKNRFGVPHVYTGVYFDGCVGMFKELPPAKELDSRHIEWVKKRQPIW
jgi:hypothetical protein